MSEKRFSPRSEKNAEWANDWNLQSLDIEQRNKIIKQIKGIANC